MLLKVLNVIPPYSVKQCQKYVSQRENHFYGIKKSPGKYRRLLFKRLNI